MAAVREGVLQPVASWELAQELVEVMRRPRMARYGISENDVEDILVVLAPFLPSVEVEPALRDPDDAHVVAAAIAGQAEAIVSGDRDLLDDEQLRLWLEARRVRVLTPRNLLEQIAGT